MDTRNPEMATSGKDNVDYRLLNRLSNLVICSRCLRQGRVTPIPQVFSSQHRVRNVCDTCGEESGAGLGGGRRGHRRKLAAVVKLRP